jgi:hypothetical protein
MSLYLSDSSRSRPAYQYPQITREASQKPNIAYSGIILAMEDIPILATTVYIALGLATLYELLLFYILRLASYV